MNCSRAPGPGMLIRRPMCLQIPEGGCYTGQGLCTALQTGSRGTRRLLAPAPGIEREQGFAFTVMLLSREEELRMKTPALLSWCRKKVGQGTKATHSTKTHPTTGHSLPACWDAESSAEAKCKGNCGKCAANIP